MDRILVEKLNERLAKQGKPLVKWRPDVLGISRAALASESFLSAASFQETTRVLTRAALARQIDYLIGVKENIIIGKPIPLGTNFHLYQNVEIEENTEPLLAPVDADTSQ